MRLDDIDRPGRGQAAATGFFHADDVVIRGNRSPGCKQRFHHGMASLLQLSSNTQQGLSTSPEDIKADAVIIAKEV
jgi:hypothetical protein